MATRDTVIRVITPAIAIVFVAAACRHDGRGPPRELVDGSPARVLEIDFEGVAGPVVETSARVRPAGRLPCGDGSGSVGRGVERVGAFGQSVTILSRPGRIVRGCDRVRGGDWCGRAFARVRPQRAFDPRLSLTCGGAGDSPVAFGWIEPGVDAGYVVVAHDGYAEAYPVLGSTPVRVTTEHVDVEASSARFKVSEHTGSGRRLRRYVLQPQVAG